MLRRRPAAGRIPLTGPPALAVFAVLTVAACGSGSTGSSDSATSPATTSHAASPSASAPALDASALPARGRTALGDLRTIDPCSLVDLAAFAGIGDAAYGDPQSMDYCVVVVQAPQGQTEVHLGEIVTVDSAKVGAGGSPQVVKGAPGQPTCSDQVAFTDGLGLVADAVPPGTTGATQQTCAVADAALAGAITAIGAHKVSHRTYPARSFGPVDPCTVLTAAAVAKRLPALAHTKAVSAPARHQCDFGARTATTTYAALVLGAAYQRFDGGPTSTTMTVGSHQVVIIPTFPTGRATECTGYGPHIPYPSKSGSAAMEMAELHVSLPDGAPEAKACQDVAALAKSVFALLPR
jgi:hypothetical protein